MLNSKSVGRRRIHRTGSPDAQYLSAKRSLAGAKFAMDAWYPYYAGYTSAFVERVLEKVGATRGIRVLDPWNGAGTTTALAARIGAESTGLDLNLAPCVAAIGRLARTSDAAALERALNRLEAGVSLGDAELAPDDPLREWLSPGGASAVRGLQIQIGAVVPPSTAGSTVAVSAQARRKALFSLALISAVGSLVRPQASSNPTWVTPPPRPRQISRDQIQRAFSSRARAMIKQVREHGMRESGSVRVGVADSRKIPCANEEMDLVITSPPYCTRIDYVAQSRMSLAVLGEGPQQAHYTERRRSCMGTPLTRARDLVDPRPEWGKKVAGILQAIRTHPSRDSSSYYYKTYWQYFDDVFCSLSEVQRVLRRSGHAWLVLQTSYYKNIHIDLPELYASMSSELGFSSRVEFEHPVDRVLTSINTRAYRHLRDRSYREATVVLHR